MNKIPTEEALLSNVEFIRTTAFDLGFNDIGFTNIDLGPHANHLQRWIDAGHYADMDYMHKHGTKRYKPEELVPNTCRIISVRMDYLPPNPTIIEELNRTDEAYVSIYARGRDYHKVMRKKLNTLAKRVSERIGPFGYRAFVDSAPVLERAIAEKSGLGWIGKNSCVISKKSGSWFFLGEIFTDLPLPISDPHENNHCGRCTRCIDVCPTQAIVEPYVVDARRCISYLTIENKGDIPEEFRKAIGNRIFGCDDCQLVCPWNRFAKSTPIEDLWPRESFQSKQLADLFSWTEDEFLKRTEGSPIRRTGYEGWLRNIAIAMGNAPPDPMIVAHLKKKKANATQMVEKHIDWAIDQQQRKI